jgi:hypothetical protein
MGSSFVSLVGLFEIILNSAHLVHIFQSNIHLLSQVQGVFFEDVTDVVLVSPGWLDRDFEEFTYELDQRGINVLVRVGGREVMYGLGNLRTL